MKSELLTIFLFRLFLEIDLIFLIINSTLVQCITRSILIRQVTIKQYP